jgi:ElaB/YqjD/DUF883 family membrane-anchored ribosome-binding protein
MSDDKKPTIWDEIRRLSDEVELKVHLASMEAKDRWQALKPRVKALEEKLEAKAEAASDRVVEEMKNVGALIKELRDDVVARVK